MDLKSFKFNMGTLKRLTDPKTAGDLNIFLEKLPQNTGQTALIAAGVVWTVAAALGLFTMMKTQELIKMRNDLRETSALQPNVPRIADKPVSAAQVKDFATTLSQLYSMHDLKVKSQQSAIYITASDTSAFGAFREAVGHVQNGGNGWRVNVDRLCVGRECQGDKLAALLKISKVKVENSQ